jgi:hypothetical protein
MSQGQPQESQEETGDMRGPIHVMLRVAGYTLLAASEQALLVSDDEDAQALVDKIAKVVGNLQSLLSNFVEPAEPQS